MSFSSYTWSYHCNEAEEFPLLSSLQIYFHLYAALPPRSSGWYTQFLPSFCSHNNSRRYMRMNYSNWPKVTQKTSQLDQITLGQRCSVTLQKSSVDQQVFSAEEMGNGHSSLIQHMFCMWNSLQYFILKPSGSKWWESVSMPSESCSTV